MDAMMAKPEVLAGVVCVGIAAAVAAYSCLSPGKELSKSAKKRARKKAAKKNGSGKKDSSKKKKKKKSAPKKTAPAPKEEPKGETETEEEEESAESKAAGAANGKPRRRRKKKKKAAASEASAPAAAADDGWATVTTKKKKPRQAKKRAPAAASAGAASEATAKVAIQPNKIGHIIGPKGATLHKIQDLTGAKIQMPQRDPADGERANRGAVVKNSWVVITGSKDAVTKAKKAVVEIITKGYTKLLADPSFTEGAIQVHPDYFHLLIGKSGRNIRELQDKLNVKIVMPKQDRGVTINTKSALARASRVGVVGNKADVQKAKDAIKHLVQFYHHPITHPGFTHCELDVPEYMFSRIIGPRGQMIKSIKGDTKAEVHMPGGNMVNRKVVIVGLPASVAKARARVMKIADECDAEDSAPPSVVEEAPQKQTSRWGDPRDEAEDDGPTGYEYHGGTADLSAWMK